MDDSKNMLNVLWVEDKVNLHQSFSMEAKRDPYYLKLMPYSCWEDAEKVLVENYDDITAIILDAKCKYKNGDPDDTLLFLPNVLARLGELALLKKRTIPWFILSAGDGGDSGEVGRLDWTKARRLEWDDWKDDFYKKSIDRPALFARIRKLAAVSNEIQIKTILYKPVFEALNGMEGFDQRIAKSSLTDVLTALHFPLDNLDFKASLYYNQLRQVLECLFRACNKVGLVPDQCIEKGQVNLHQSYMYVAGKEAKYAGVVYNGAAGEKIATAHIASEISSILYLGNNKSHTVELDENDQLMMEEFFRTNNSKYIIFSLALQMCDVIVWLKNYIADHNDKEVNLGKCKLIDQDEKSKYEGREFYPEMDENRYWHCGDCSVPIRSIHVGKKIRLRDVADNTDPRTKQQYKYFAYYDVI